MLVIISLQSIPQVISVLKKDASHNDHQGLLAIFTTRIHVLPLILTSSPPLPKKAHQETSPNVHTLLRMLIKAKEMTPQALKAFKPW